MLAIETNKIMNTLDQCLANIHSHFTLLLKPSFPINDNSVSEQYLQAIKQSELNTKAFLKDEPHTQ